MEYWNIGILDYWEQKRMFMCFMDSFKDLDAWKYGMELVDEVYKLTSHFPKQEMYGLVTQLRKASNSVVANTAEGFGRFTYADKANKYVIARGECTEVEALLLIAVQQKFLDKELCEKAFQLCNKTGRILSGLIKASYAKSKK